MIPVLTTTSPKSYNSIVKAFNKELDSRAAEIAEAISSAKSNSSSVYLKVNRLSRRVDELEQYISDLDVVLSQWG